MMPNADADAFWRVKTLDQMTKTEWESLCDGCGRCCLHKLRDDDTGALDYTNVACRLLDTHTCRCRDYANRSAQVPDCISLTRAALTEIDWLPPTCAYRLLDEGKALPEWHPLVSGDALSPRAAGVAITDRVVSELDAGPLEHHIVTWPARWPKSGL